MVKEIIIILKFFFDFVPNPNGVDSSDSNLYAIECSIKSVRVDS